MKKRPSESKKLHKIQNLPNLCRDIDFEKFSPIGVRPEYEQKHKNRKINTDAKTKQREAKQKINMRK